MTVDDYLFKNRDQLFSFYRNHSINNYLIDNYIQSCGKKGSSEDFQKITWISDFLTKMDDDFVALNKKVSKEFWRQRGEFAAENAKLGYKAIIEWAPSLASYYKEFFERSAIKSHFYCATDFFDTLNITIKEEDLTLKAVKVKQSLLALGYRNIYWLKKNEALFKKEYETVSEKQEEAFAFQKNKLGLYEKRGSEKPKVRSEGFKARLTAFIENTISDRHIGHDLGFSWKTEESPSRAHWLVALGFGYDSGETPKQTEKFFNLLEATFPWFKVTEAERDLINGFRTYLNMEVLPNTIKGPIAATAIFEMTCVNAFAFFVNNRWGKHKNQKDWKELLGNIQWDAPGIVWSEVKDLFEHGFIDVDATLSVVKEFMHELKGLSDRMPGGANLFSAAQSASVSFMQSNDQGFDEHELLTTISDVLAMDKPPVNNNKPRL